MHSAYSAFQHVKHIFRYSRATRLIAVFFVLLTSVIASISIYAGNAQAAANDTINFQARVLSNTGAVVGDGFYSVQFNIYAQGAGGLSQWTETQVTTSKNGYITVSLGSVSPFGSNIDWSQEQWLGMNINGDGEMSPRMKITAVPLAFRAVQADSITTPTGTISSSQLAQLAPGLVQSVTSTNAALRLNQAGSGGILQLQSGGSDVLTLSNAGDLSIARGLTVGNSTTAVAGTIRWTGTAFEGYNGSAWAPLGSGGGAGSLINIIKPTNETVNNSNVLQNDDHLTFPIGANEEYSFRFVIQANSGATPDLRFAVTAPSGATCRVSYADHEGATSVGQYGCGVTTASIPGNGAVDLYEVTGSVTNGANSGSVTLQWAQFTTNASNTIVYAGSYVQAIRSIGAGSSGQVFVQDGNAFGETAILGTSDNNNLALIANGIERLTVSTVGNVGVGDTTPTALFTVGTNDALQVDASGNLQTSGALSVGGVTTLSGGLVANNTATGVSDVTTGTGTNTTTITISADSFAVNDVVFIDNAGQDYYTRIVSDLGTGVYTVSPAVSFENNRTVTKYNIQNIGATASDYSNQANRFFQGYFLGGLVVGAGSTTISDGAINSTTTLRLQENGGSLSIGGALNVTGTITGDASGLTNIDASQIAGGTVSDSNLSSNVTLLGNTFNGSNQLVRLDGTGALPALSGANLTGLSASNVSDGTLSDSRLSSNVTVAGNTFNGANQLVQLDAGGKLADSLLSTNITAVGNTFNGNNQLVQLTGTGALPALNGAGLTSLSASNISSGTMADARLSTNVTLLGNTFNGSNQLVRLDGTGALPALSGANLTGLSASNVSDGTLSDSRLSSNVTVAGNTFNGANQLVQLDAGGKLADSLLSTNITAVGNTFNGNNQLVQLTGTGALPALNGAGLTSLSASNISSGTMADARLSTNVTLLGNTFNGSNQLVRLDGTGALPALSGANLTGLSASNVSDGTLSDSRLSSNVTVAGNTFNGANQLVQLDAGGKLADSLLSTNITAVGNTFNGNNQLVQLTGTGALPALNGAGLTSLSASNISSGTMADARLSTNVTLLGNTFNGSNQLVRLDGTGALPALSGANLTGLSASNVSDGTLSDSRLSSNVTVAGNTFNGANQLVQLDAGGKLADSLLSTNITAVGNTFNGNNQLVQLTGTGALPALNGAGLTSLSASNISSGTMADARLSTNVTLLGNTFNGSNQLVRLDGTGALPALSGANLTGLSASNVSDGTLSDSRLSSNVGLVNLSQTYSAQQTFAANILLGTDSATPTAGTLVLHDSVASNGFTSVLGTSSLTANRTINLPDASGTICLTNSASCGFALFAQGSAQVDTTTNNSIFINKTGTAGDILNLQKDGSPVLRMLNSGALQMTLTSTTAFTIENAGGTDFFNVDTSGGLVRIGGAAADATGVLFVLDTKNTAGDPTGTNGSMYYNSADNKSRCYENGNWVDCNTMTLAGETTLGAANGTINVNLNGNYEYIECRVDIVSRSAASIPYLRFNNNTGAAAYGWNAYGIVAAATTDWQDASDSEIQLTGTQTGTNIISADMKITNLTGSNKVIDWTSAGVEAVGTNSNRYSGVGGFYNAPQITSIQIVASTGTFAAGSHAWCQGKNVR